MDEHVMHILHYVRLFGIDSAMINRRNDLEKYYSVCDNPARERICKAQIFYENSMKKIADRFLIMDFHIMEIDRISSMKPFAGKTNNM